jgi:hypothetical protein
MIALRIKRIYTVALYLTVLIHYCVYVRLFAISTYYVFLHVTERVFTHKTLKHYSCCMVYVPFHNNRYIREGCKLPPKCY